MRDWLPPLLLASAALLAVTGLPDRAGLDGASQGLGLGVAICAPIWLFNLWRRSRRPRDDRD